MGHRAWRSPGWRHKQKSPQRGQLSPASSLGKGRTSWASPKCLTKERPSLSCPSSFCPHVVFRQAEDLAWAWIEAAELENGLQALVQAWSAVTQHGWGCYRLERALVPDSAIRRTVVPRLCPFLLDPEAHMPKLHRAELPPCFPEEAMAFSQQAPSNGGFLPNLQIAEEKNNKNQPPREEAHGLDHNCWSAPTLPAAQPSGWEGKPSPWRRSLFPVLCVRHCSVPRRHFQGSG